MIKYRPLFKLVLFMLFLQLFFQYCTGAFIRKEEAVDLNRELNGVYVTKIETEVGNNQKLESGKIVRIYVKTTADAIKIYAYDHKDLRENALGKCILFLVAEDFPDKIYDKAIVIKEANKILEPYVEKKDKKTDKN